MHGRSLLLSFFARPRDSNKCCVRNSLLDIVSQAINCRGRISGERELKICDVKALTLRANLKLLRRPEKKL